jgi:hypothetical protein
MQATLRELSRITEPGDRDLRMVPLHGAQAALMAVRRNAANAKYESCNGHDTLCFAA